MMHPGIHAAFTPRRGRLIADLDVDDPLLTAAWPGVDSE